MPFNKTPCQDGSSVSSINSWFNVYYRVLMYVGRLESTKKRKGPFTQAIFVAATQCNFCRAEVGTSKSHV